MTTTAEDLVAATAALQAAADAYNGKKQEIDDRVNALIPTVNGTLFKALYIDAVNGDDANVGNSENPLQTLGAAAALTSNAGAYMIYLKSDVVVDQRLTFKGTSVFFGSDVLNTKRRMDFANQIDGVLNYSPSLRAGNHFMNFAFRDIIFGNTTAAPHIVYKRMIEAQAFLNLDSWICEFDTQAGHDLPFVATNAQVLLWMLSATIPAEQAGLWIDGVAAATDPATVPNVINTNLATL